MDKADYNLIIRTPVHKLSSKTDTPTPIPSGNLTERVKNTWMRSKVWNYGADTGRFSLVGSVSEMANYYSTWLTNDLVEISGGVTTWNGMIAKMTLNWGVMPLTIDYTQMYNRVIATVGDGIGTYTSAASNAYSQEAYGVRTKYILPGVDTTAEAQYERDAFLEAHAWPHEAPSGRKWGKEYARLDVEVIGYGHTLNNYYADDSAITPATGVSAAITIVITDSEYINPRAITSNTVALYDDTDLIPAGEYLDHLLRLSDASGNLYRGWIIGNRNFYYRNIANTPDYVIRGGKVFRSSGSKTEISPRMLEPGIYRNLDLPISGQNRDSFLADRRDIWVGSVWVDAKGETRWEPMDKMVKELMLILKT